MTRHFFITLFIALFLSAPVSANQQLVADLDQEEVFITTDFTGAELLLFGAFDRASIDDIAIIVTGPPKTIAVRRKKNIIGIWLNTAKVDAIDLPSFYHILTTRPLNDIANLDTRTINHLGFTQIPFQLDDDNSAEIDAANQWKEALIRNMKNTGLWANRNGEIKIIGDVLFRANIEIPANIIPGKYKVRTLHFRNGIVVNENISSITVSKTGLSALIYRLAHEYSVFYGIFAIIFAVASGWMAAIAFRK